MASVALALISGCGYERRSTPATSTTTSTVDQRSSARQVSVYKVTLDIPKGMSGRVALDDGYITVAMIAEEFKPVTAVTLPEEITDKLAVANFAVGQIVVIGMFAPP